MFQAFALHNATRKGNTENCNNEALSNMWRVLRKYMYGQSGVETVRMHQFSVIVNNLQSDLKEIRKTLRQRLHKISAETGRREPEHPEMLVELVKASNDMMVSFAGRIINEAVQFMADNKPPCDFSAVGIGSLGRGEATPYSDLEYFFLIEDAEFRPYFEKLAVLTYFLIGALNETKLNSMDISELNGDCQRDIEQGWFVDGRRHGYQIDGITLSADNIPTRAKSLWKLKDSGGFIATPKNLLKEYKAVLDNPGSDSLRGDITSLLMFTKLIFSVKDSLNDYEARDEECLLSEFERGRNCQNHHKNDQRKEANLKMLKNDLSKFSFHPEYDLYSSGFLMNVKTELYRFPSILLLDLVTLIDIVGKDSWSSLSLLTQRFSQGFADDLYRVLVFASFSRLRCYLAVDAHADGFRAGSDRAMPSGVGESDQNLGFGMLTTWTMSRDEFFSLCRDIVRVQIHLKSQSITDVNDLVEMMSKSVENNSLAKVMAHYYCCEWSEVMQCLEGLEWFYWPMDSRVRVALAFSLLKIGQSTKAHEVLRALEQSLGNNGKLGSLIHINILRLLAKACSQVDTNSVCQPDGPNDLYVKALNLIREYPSDTRHKIRREEAFILFEYGLLLSKEPSNRAVALDTLQDAFRIFILDSATHPKCRDLGILNEFKSWSLQQQLAIVGNDSRELAHCIFAIASLIEDQFVAQEFYKKAQELGLEFWAHTGEDNYTKVIILTDLGRVLNNTKYLRGALALLQKSCGAHNRSELETEIMVSIVECIGSATENIGHSAELENRLELELNRVIRDADTPRDSTEDDEREHGVLLNSKRTDNWYSRAISALQNIPADLSLEDLQLLLDLRRRFEQMGKDTITFNEAVQIVIPSGGKHLIVGDKSIVR